MCVVSVCVSVCVCVCVCLCVQCLPMPRRRLGPRGLDERVAMAGTGRPTCRRQQAKTRAVPAVSLAGCLRGDGRRPWKVDEWRPARQAGRPRRPSASPGAWEGAVATAPEAIFAPERFSPSPLRLRQQATETFSPSPLRLRRPRRRTLRLFRVL